MPSEDARRRAGRITVHRYDSAHDADRHDLEFWIRMSDADRVLLVWQLSLEQWELHGAPPYQPELSRSVTRVLRR